MNHAEPKPRRDPDALRITNQYRDRDRKGMVYELQCGTSKLALLSSPSEGPGDPEWRFEARTTQAPQLVVIGDWGLTRALALEAVGRLWLEKLPTLGLPTFDWTAIATALQAVKAV
jgi:hypothetical protein